MKAEQPSLAPTADAEPIDTGHGVAPARAPLRGTFVSLLPLDARRDAEHLYRISHGAGREQLWRYMFNGPFESEAAMREWLASIETSADPLFFTVQDNASGQPLGMVSFMNIVPNMLRLELGNIWYTPSAQRTRANTEAVFLMLQYCFETLRYRRAEWKCDDLNAPSKQAALRLGFTYEGLFRQHMVVKMKNRDTAWFSMLDSEWPLVRANFIAWLKQAQDAKLSLAQLNREALSASKGQSEQ